MVVKLGQYRDLILGVKTLLRSSRSRSHTMIQIITLLVAYAYAVDGFTYQPSFSVTPGVVRYTLPPVRTYYPRYHLPVPSFDFGFGRPFYQPELPPFFAEDKPSNETAETEKPLEEVTTTVKPDYNDTVVTNALSFDDLFKKTIISPEFGFVPREPIIISDTPVYPQIKKFVLPPSPIYSSVDLEHYRRIDDAYGLTGFRPFFYDEYLRKLNSSKCSDHSPSSHQSGEDSNGDLLRMKEETTPDKPSVVNIIKKITKPDPNIVVFNTKDTPYLTAPEKVETDDELDVRMGRDDDPFFKVYKDIMFLNKTFLTTVAPYLH